LKKKKDSTGPGGKRGFKSESRKKGKKIKPTTTEGRKMKKKRKRRLLRTSTSWEKKGTPSKGKKSRVVAQ